MSGVFPMTDHSHPPPYLYVDMDTDSVMVTVASDSLNVCAECPHLHVRIMSGVTPDTLRNMAQGLCIFAEMLERAA